MEDVKEAHTKTFEDVKGILEKELRQEEAKKIARDEANRAFNRLFKSKDIADYAKKNSLPLKETDYFSFGKGPEDNAEKNAFSDAAFPVAKGDLAPIFSMGQSYVLLKVADKKASAIPPVKDVSESIRSSIEQEKKTALAKERAEKVLAQLKAGKADWAAAAKENKLEIKTAKEFTRQGDFIPEFGKAPALKETAFALSDKKAYPDKVLETDKGMVVIKFKERQVPGQEEFQKQKERLEKQVVQMKKEDLFNQFLERLKAKVEITVDKKLLAMD